MNGQFAVLVIRTGSMAGTKFPINKNYITIGRSSNNDIILQDNYSSKKHAAIRRTPDGNYILKDLRSQNGTKVGGVPITEYTLSNKEIFTVGRTEIEFVNEPIDVNTISPPLQQTSTSPSACQELPQDIQSSLPVQVQPDIPSTPEQQPIQVELEKIHEPQESTPVDTESTFAKIKSWLILLFFAGIIVFLGFLIKNAFEEEEIKVDKKFLYKNEVMFYRPKMVFHRFIVHRQDIVEVVKDIIPNTLRITGLEGGTSRVDLINRDTDDMIILYVDVYNESYKTPLELEYEKYPSLSQQKQKAREWYEQGLQVLADDKPQAYMFFKKAKGILDYYNVTATKLYMDIENEYIRLEEDIKTQVKEKMDLAKIEFNDGRLFSLLKCRKLLLEIMYLLSYNKYDIRYKRAKVLKEIVEERIDALRQQE